MISIPIDWTEVKHQIDDHLQMLHVETVSDVAGDREYRLHVLNGQADYFCTLSESKGTPAADLDEFEATYKANSNGPIQNRRPDGVQRTQITPVSTPGMKLVLVGKMFTAALDATTEQDYSFGEDRDLAGAWIEVADHQPGDYVELQVYHPTYGVVGQFGETVFIPPCGKFPPIISEGTQAIAAGLSIRFKYVAVAGGVDRTVFAYMRTYKA